MYKEIACEQNPKYNKIGSKKIEKNHFLSVHCTVSKMEMFN